MKQILTITALLLTPVFSFASTPDIEANSVLASKEIAALLQVEKKTHNLYCEKMTAKDVTVTSDGTGMDAFEIVYGCNDKTYGANVQRIHFSGGVYLADAKSTKAEVVLSKVEIELSE